MSERITCPKCGACSGDDWSQCEGQCPMIGSPHYKPNALESDFTLLPSSAVAHPAYNAFVEEMRGRAYGRGALCTAFMFFIAGWEANDKRGSNSRTDVACETCNAPGGTPCECVEGTCAQSKDGIHCEHWWDGDACCTCDAPAMDWHELRAQGMEP